jgi:hypothetical protein
MKTVYSQERLMSVLWDLYSKTINDKFILKYGIYCKEQEITNAMFPILVKHGILKYSKEMKEGKGKKCNVYTWNSIPPNIHMANKLSEEIQRYAKIANQKSREKKLEQQRLELELLTGEPKLREDSNFKTFKPNYEFKEEQETQEDHKFVMFNHLNPTEFDEFTTSTITPKVIKEEVKNKTKKISIFWGAILIQW